MAHLAQAQLLRALVFPVLAVACLSSAQAGDDPPPVEFAPGSIGGVDLPIGQMIRNAEKGAEALRKELSDTPAVSEPIDPTELDRMTTEALNHPVARGLLGIDDAPLVGDESREALYGETRAILFASFSMPAPALRAMMEEGKSYGIPVVFRGFVNNSVYDTRARLETVFQGAEQAEGFAIDPTAFRRFRIEAVPALVVLKTGLDVCQSANCEFDAPPAHDILKGNIPTGTALRMISVGQGDASEVAKLILSGQGASPDWSGKATGPEGETSP